MSTANQAMTGARRWWPVVVLAVLGALVGYAFAAVARPTYVARAYVAAVARSADDNLAAISYANAYAKMSSQSEVVNSAVQASDGTTTAADLRTHVRTTSSADSPVIEVDGSASSAQHAADLANQTAAGLVRAAARSSGQTRIDFVVLSSASAPVDKAAPRAKVNAAVGCAVGLLLGGLLLLTGPGRTLTRRDQRDRAGTGRDPQEPVEELVTVPRFTDPEAHLPAAPTLPDGQDPSGPPGGTGFGGGTRGG